jgi:hypothetical protein
MLSYNEEHLARLKEAINKKDIKIWNRWRISNKNITPNFRNADLSRTDLRGADLRWAILKKANLQGVNLTGAELSKAKLSKANIRGAILNNIAFARKYFPNDIVFIEYICSEIKSTTNWKYAFYDEKMLKYLDLPPDHNERLREKEENNQKS